MLTIEHSKTLYPYRCLMRPPTPGAIPNDGLDHVELCGGHTLSGHYYWGTAVYTRELTREEIEHYDLEQTCYVVVD